MNYEASTATNTTMTPEELSREAAARHELASRIVSDSTGSVGIYSSMDLTYDQKTVVQTAIAGRNGPGHQLPDNSNLTQYNSGGWSNYGEATIPHAVHNQTTTPGEKVVFATDPQRPDRVAVGYSFHANGYTDASGRPGNSLAVSFSLPKETAASLKTALEQAPDFINDVLWEQAAALGYGAAAFGDVQDGKSRYWRQTMGPHYGFRDFRPDRERVLTIEERDQAGHISGQQDYQFGEGRSISTPIEAVETADQLPAIEAIYAEEVQAGLAVDPDLDVPLSHLSWQLTYYGSSQATHDGVSQADQDAHWYAIENVYIKTVQEHMPSREAKLQYYTEKLGAYIAERADENLTPDVVAHDVNNTMEREYDYRTYTFNQLRLISEAMREHGQEFNPDEIKQLAHQHLSAQKSA